jgi:hypothetical protein
VPGEVGKTMKNPIYGSWFLNLKRGLSEYDLSVNRKIAMFCDEDDDI